MELQQDDPDLDDISDDDEQTTLTPRRAAKESLAVADATSSAASAAAPPSPPPPSPPPSPDIEAGLTAGAGAGAAPEAGGEAARARLDTSSAGCTPEEDPFDVNPLAKALGFQPNTVGLVNKANVSNSLTFLVFVVGVVLYQSVDKAEGAVPKLTSYVLNLGLFGFAGGITNWLAVKMLFDHVGFPGGPYLIGSGVIPSKFVEIRNAIKDMLLGMFFDPEFLGRYIHDWSTKFKETFDLEAKLNEFLQSAEMDALIDRKLGEFAMGPQGMMIAAMGFAPQSLKPMILPFVHGMGADAAPMLQETFDIEKMVSVERVRAEVEALVNVKLEEISAEMVTGLMEHVIREHLGWLVVWGNVFGGLIGLVSAAAGFGVGM